MTPPAERGLVTLRRLLEILAPLRREGRRIVFTNGCFDILHPGHAIYLEKARSLGDLLVVGLNSDRSVQSLGKGSGRPICTEAERATVLGALRSVDFVVIFDDPTPIGLIEAIRPDVLVKGGDWAVEKIVGREVVEAAGGRVVTIPTVEGKSTTGIVDRILARCASR